MPLLPIISFDEFVKAVNDAIYANKDFSDDREYRIKVGQIAKEFKEEKWGKRSKDINSKTRDWIASLSDHFGGSWIDIKNLSFQRITDLTNGKARAIHAHAIHYRLHAELDLPQFAKRIDEFVFDGEIFKHAHGCSVFINQVSKYYQMQANFSKVLTYPDAYQWGRREFDEVKSALLLPNGGSNAGSVAVCGAGGYGKSYLAQEICDDKGIQNAFPGGIYWLQFGLLDNSDENIGVVGLAEAIDRMLAAQHPIPRSPALVWDNRDSDIRKLVDILPSARLLLIADDLWAPKQSSWLSQVPANVSVLMTTRRQSVAKQAMYEINIQRLSHDASYKLLTHGMKIVLPDQQKRFQELAKGFEGWPLLLGLANGVFKQMNGDPEGQIDRSLSQYAQFLADDQIDAWDIEEAGEEAIEKRRKLVGFCIETGLKAIHSSNKPDLLRKLAVFPSDTDIPFSVAIDYLVKITGKMISKTKCLTLLRFFSDYSFFSSFNESTQFLRLHAEILRYFRVCLNDSQSRSQHSDLLASMEAHCSSGWETLPHDHTYGWTHLLNHLEKANRFDEADDLRTDFHWLKAKLGAVGALQRSFVGDIGRSDARLVGRAINLSVTNLSNRSQSLAHQLFGRLGHERNPRLIELIKAARSDLSCWPIPLKPHLPPIGSELLRLIGHSQEVGSAVFDPSGRRVVTASHDGTARLWDAETGASIGMPLIRHGDIVSYAAFDPTGRRIVTASWDRTAQLWDAETGAPIGKPFEGHSGIVNYAVFDPSGRKIVTASNDGTARLWDAETGASIGKPLIGHSGIVRCAVFDPSGSRIVTASLDGTARLWNAKTGESIGKPLEGHGGSVLSAGFDPTSRRIVTASGDRTARLWDAETSEPIGMPLEGHGTFVNSAVFDPTGRRIVTASWDKTARLWDAETGEPIGMPLGGHDSVVNSAVFDPTGCRILTASGDGTARLWDAETSEPIGMPLEGHANWVMSAAFDPSGRRVVTDSGDGTARLGGAEAGAQIGKQLEGHAGYVTGAAFDPSGRRVVTTSWFGTAWLWDATTEVQIGKPLEGHAGRISSAAFDSSGRRIVTACGDGTAWLWDAETGVPIGKPLEGHADHVMSAVFDPSCRRIVTASWDWTARLWDPETGALIGKPLEGHADHVMSAAFDPYGRKLVTVSRDTARLWDAETGAPIGRPIKGDRGPIMVHTLDASGRSIVTASRYWCEPLSNADTGVTIGKRTERHAGPIASVAFDPSGRRVVTASYDKTARMWDAQTGAPIGKPLEGHNGAVTHVAFDPSGSKIVTASQDLTARIWDTETSKLIGKSLEGHSGFIESVVFDPSGRWIVTIAHDKTARLWDANTGICLAIIDFDAEPVSVGWQHKHLAVALESGLLCFFLLA